MLYSTATQGICQRHEHDRVHGDERHGAVDQQDQPHRPVCGVPAVEPASLCFLRDRRCAVSPIMCIMGNMLDV